MKKRKIHSYIRRTLALTLAFTMLGSSTSIPEAVVKSGLIEYIGTVGRNFLNYIEIHTARADYEGTVPTESGLTAEDIAAIVRDNTNISVSGGDSYYYDIHNCDHSTVEGYLNEINVAAEAIQKAIGESTSEGDLNAKIEKILLDTKVIQEKQIPHIIAALYDNTSDVDEDGNPKNPDDVEEWIGGKSVANLLLYYSDMMEMWFEYGETAGPQLSDDEPQPTPDPDAPTGINSNSLGVYKLNDEKDKLDLYSYYTISNNISSTRKTLQLGLGYTQPDGDLLDKTENPDIKDLFWDKDKVGSDDPRMNGMYLEVDRETRNLSNEVSNIWYNLNDNFGYFQYSNQGKKDGFVHWKDWDASLARDFRELLSMYRIYNVAHVYSLNSELGATWQPTPEDLSYAKERILNEGYVNAYMGYWQVKADEYNNHKASKERYNEILGDDITTSYEAYLVEVLPYTRTVTKTKTQDLWDAKAQAWTTVTFEYEEKETDYILNAEHVYKNMELGEPITLSDAVRIIYRALGQDVYTYTTYRCADPNIKLETSPCSIGLPNPLSLAGDSVYMSVVRNNVARINIVDGQFGFSDNIRDVNGKGNTPGDNDIEIKDSSNGYLKIANPVPNDVYLAKAKADGVVNEEFTEEAAQSYQLSNAEFWVLASNLMQIYGEPEMNSTETLSLLQVYGDAYPIQAGNQIADAWAYLKARGVLGDEDDTTSNYMNATDALNIATRIKDKDSRLNYKEINLTISLEQAVVDNGFFPLFNDRLELVEYYDTTVSYDYKSSSIYNVVIPLESVDAASQKATVKIGVFDATDGDKLIDTDEIGISLSNSSVYKHLLLSIPYSLTAMNRIEVTFQGVTYIIPNKVLETNAGVALFDSNNVCTATQYFNNESYEDYSDIFKSYVDHQRHGSGVKFSMASWGSTVAERVGFFFKYVFSPEKAYARNPALTEVMLLDGGITSPIGGNAVTATTTYKIEGSPWNIYLVALGIMSPYHSGYSNSLASKGSLPLGLLSQSLYSWTKYGPTSSRDSYLGMMDTANGDVTNPSSISNLSVLRNLSGLGGKSNMTYIAKYAKCFSSAYGYFWDKKSVTDLYGNSAYPTRKKLMDSLFNQTPTADEMTKIERLANLFCSGSIKYTIKESEGNPGTNNIVLTITGTDNVKLNEVREIIKAGDRGNYKTTDDGGKSEYVTDKTDEDPNVSDSGFAGGSYEEVRNMYPDQIMNRNADMYIAYKDLVDKGIVQTRSTPKMDDNGCMSFYLTDRGQVVIDTVNNTVSINCIYLNMSGSVSAIYQTEKDLYVNYNCLVGALATYDINTSEAEKVQSTSGTGSNAVYQLCTGVVASDRVETVTANTYNVENGNGTSIKSHIIYKYNNVELVDEELTDVTGTDEKDPSVYQIGSTQPKVLLLSGVFPTANWVIVESTEGAYLYTFYNRKMFDYAYSNENLSMALDGYWNSKYMYPDSNDKLLDGTLSNEMTDELPTMRRVKIGDALVLSKLETLYNKNLTGYKENGDEVTGSAESVPLLKNTIYSLLSLANQTNSTVLSEDYLCRRFSIPYWTDINNADGSKTGKVGFLETVGYVYVLPEYSDGVEGYTGYDHDKYVYGEHWLPYEFNSGNVIEYNLNTYGSVTNSEYGVIDLPYGYVVGTINTGASTGETCIAKYVLHKETDIRRSEDKCIAPNQVDGSGVKLADSFFISDYKLKLEGADRFIAAPVGLFKEVTSIVKDKVSIGTLSKYTTSQCSFYLGSRRLIYVNLESKGTATGFTFYKDGNASKALFSLEDSGLATVVTRDYYGRHHFVLSPNTTVINTININVVDADDYAIDYSDNPFYSGIKAWVTNLDRVSSTILYILFYIVPYILLLWVLLLIMLALIPRSAVRGVSTLIGMDIISIFTVGRREVANWHGYKVVVPLIIAFISLGLFYGPNLLKMIEIVSDWAYKLSGLV